MVRACSKQNSCIDDEILDEIVGVCLTVVVPIQTRCQKRSGKIANSSHMNQLSIDLIFSDRKSRFGLVDILMSFLLLK